jgi:hypothetical protein
MIYTFISMKSIKHADGKSLKSGSSHNDVTYIDTAYIY